MSKYELTKNTIFLFIFTLAGYYTGEIYFNHNAETESANFSSISPAKPLLYGKNLDLILVKIEATQLAESDDDITTLKAYFKAQTQQTTKFTYNWNLPNDVTLINGEFKGEFSISSDQSEIYSVEIQLKNFSKESKKIASIQTEAIIRNQVVGNSYAISSQPENTWEYHASDLKKVRDETVSNNDTQSTIEEKIIR